MTLKFCLFHNLILKATKAILIDNPNYIFLEKSPTLQQTTKQIVTTNFILTKDMYITYLSYFFIDIYLFRTYV